MVLSKNNQRRIACAVRLFVLHKSGKEENMGIFDSMLKKAIANQFSVADKANALANVQETTVSGENTVYNSGGQYSPSNPLTPQHQGFNPWQYQFQVGSNLVITPRTEREGVLLPFNVLRDVAANHDITALCIKMMIDQVCGDEWDIVVADKNDREHYEDDIKAVKKFFARPDKVHLFNDWLKPILYDTLSEDDLMLVKAFLHSEIYSELLSLFL